MTNIQKFYAKAEDFRKQYEFIQFTGDNYDEIIEWLGNKGTVARVLFTETGEKLLFVLSSPSDDIHEYSLVTNGSWIDCDCDSDGEGEYVFTYVKTDEEIQTTFEKVVEQ